MSLKMNEIKIDAGGILWTRNPLRTLAFAADGEYIVGGDGSKCLGVWRAVDGKEMTTIEAGSSITCLAVSKDGKWIAAGSMLQDRVFLWDAKTFQEISSHHLPDSVLGVDFSPHSTALLAASGRTAIILDIFTTPWQVQEIGPLSHETWVRAAKYSPTGDRIATATRDSVRIWASNNGQLLLKAEVEVTPQYNNGLFWVDRDHLSIICRDEIKILETSTGTITSKWRLSHAHDPSESRLRMALPRHSEFIVCSTDRTVTFWDTWTSIRLVHIRHPEDVSLVTLSPDDQSIAIGGVSGRIVIMGLSRISSHLHYLFRKPDIPVGGVILDSLRHGRLAEADASLIAATSRNRTHHVLACRALVRTRLRQWNAAILDAEESINIQPSVMGYVSKSIALAGKGDKYKAYRTCDLAFQHLCGMHVRFLLLIKAIIVFATGEHEDALSRMDDLISVVHTNPVYYAVQAYMHLLIGNSHMKSKDYEGALKSLECARSRLLDFAKDDICTITLIFGWKFDDLHITVRQRLCEALYATGRVEDASELLSEMVDSFAEEPQMKQPFMEWLSSFTQQYVSSWGDGIAWEADPFDRTIPEPQATIDSMTRTKMLRAWAKSTLTFRSWNTALTLSNSFVVPRSLVYRTICEHLETASQLIEASACFCQMMSELAEEINEDERMQWVHEFGQRCSTKLMYLGDAATNAEQYSDAIAYYSAALELNPIAPQAFLIKRSEAYVTIGLLEEALSDVEQAIILDPSSPCGYERKHAALHQAGQYEKAVEAFETMLSTISQSPDLYVRSQIHSYVTPMEIVAVIQRKVQDTIRDLPRVLINTISGGLYDKPDQATAFESLPIFNQLISSMTTQIDHARIEVAVRKYYRYATFSHKWEENEPLYDKVVHVSVYDLERSNTHDKLQMFCKVARDSGFSWAWSDTCCINKVDHFVLQEAIVAMFKWYEGSALTVIFLHGVRSPSQRGNLAESVWNSRAWTLQEYHASKVVRFYTEDWKLYMDVNIPNHKDCLDIVSEMEEATGIPAQALMSLRPGLDDVRTKLCLASRRRTTLIEDVAYSLLGIFSISLPVVYGEGDKSLGRLLGQLLTSSGDTSLLAWTGKSGSYNSCLPADISVFSTSSTTHIPLSASGTEMDSATIGLNMALVTGLYDRLVDLPVPLLAGRRIRLPCITFKLGPVAISRGKPEQVFRAQTTALGTVTIETNENLSKFGALYLVHPWIDFLLDRQPVGSISETVPEETEDVQGDPPPSVDVVVSSLGPSIASSAPKISRAARFAARLGLPLNTQSSLPLPGDASSLRPPSSMSEVDRQIRAYRAVARLRQPFGALLLTPTPDGVAAYKRVATESVITVRVVEELTPTMLNKLIDSVRILDIL